MKEPVTFYLNSDLLRRLEDTADALDMPRSVCLEVMIEKALEEDEPVPEPVLKKSFFADPFFGAVIGEDC